MSHATDCQIVSIRCSSRSDVTQFDKSSPNCLDYIYGSCVILQYPTAPVETGSEHCQGELMSDFAQLLETEIPRLRRYARALTRDASRADDMVQSCLLRAVAKQHLWQPGTDLRAWLFTILHNQNVNYVRRSVREGVTVPIDDVAPALTAPSSVEASLALRDLERAIARLPEEQRQVILLVGLEGMGYDEAAKILGIPVGTVRSRLSRGRDSLRALMDIKDEPADVARKGAANALRAAA